MCKNYFDFETYMEILNKYYNNEEIDISDIDYLNDINHIRHFYKEINRYSRDVLFKMPPYDEEKGEYFYIIYYKEKYYRISNDDLNDTYSIIETSDLKKELSKLKEQDDEYVLQEILCVDNILEHRRKAAVHISHIVRKR